MKSGAGKKDPRSYRRRSYRELIDHHGLICSRVRYRETDLHILAETDVTRMAEERAVMYRLQIERYIEGRPSFATSLIPLADDGLAPPIIRDMLAAGRSAGVGPMAAVAGAISEYVGMALLEAGQKEVIVENGGDIFLRRTAPVTIGVFAGQSPLSNRLGVRVEPRHNPLGVCTSSGTVGHSLSFGRADSVTVLADSAILADAAATRIGNETTRELDKKEAVDRALAVAGTIESLRGVLVVYDDIMGAIGEIELVPMQ